MAWAPGKGVKGKEWKDYWEVELGVSYIPWNKLLNITDQDLELLEEGGMIDEDTLPPNLKGIYIYIVIRILTNFIRIYKRFFSFNIKNAS